VSDSRERAKLRDLTTHPARYAPASSRKIEKRKPSRLDEIIEAADAFMVPAATSGVEIGVSRVPLVQRRSSSAPRAAGRAVITATQHARVADTLGEPTRAEAADVANAILDGPSALMLSAETAPGSYPLRAFAVMDNYLADWSSATLHYQPKRGEPVEVAGS